MPNQLFIPFKKTAAIPIRQQTREYILAHHTDTHPDAFKWEISRWETLRKDATACVVHVDSVKVALRYDDTCRYIHCSHHAPSYHAQLIYILTKLPNDVRQGNHFFRLTSLISHWIDRPRDSLLACVQLRRVAAHPSEFILRTCRCTVQSGSPLFATCVCGRPINRARSQANDTVQSGVPFGRFGSTPCS